jgi:hypothetical protein
MELPEICFKFGAKVFNGPDMEPIAGLQRSPKRANSLKDYAERIAFCRVFFSQSVGDALTEKDSDKRSETGTNQDVEQQSLLASRSQTHERPRVGAGLILRDGSMGRKDRRSLTSTLLHSSCDIFS